MADGAGNIADDRRLAKPAIVATIEVFAFRLRLAVEPWRTQTASRWQEEARGSSAAASMP